MTDSLGWLCLALSGSVWLCLFFHRLVTSEGTQSFRTYNQIYEAEKLRSGEGSRSRLKLSQNAHRIPNIVEYLPNPTLSPCDEGATTCIRLNVSSIGLRAIIIPVDRPVMRDEIECHTLGAENLPKYGVRRLIRKFLCTLQ
ncbi:hypothetical protein F4802DRAFT_224898 [Xylaria palmicola]|nr:hypothetical protein F4802DRAFT_224898 [Xylaria palmicola]